MKRFTHLPVIGFYTLLTVFVLLPALPPALAGERLLQITVENDTYVKLWDYWYLTSQVGHGPHSLTFTDLLFHPVGTTLAFHNFNYVQVGLMWPIGWVADEIVAYNLSVMLIMVANAFAAYALGLTLTGDRWAALFGGVLIGFNGWIVGKAMQPEMMTFFPLLGAMAAFAKGLEMGKAGWAALAAVLVGVAVLASPYYLIFAFWIFGAWTLIHLARRGHWRVPGVFVALVIPAVLPRLLPMITNRALLADGLTKIHDVRTVDIVKYIVPTSHPVFDFPAVRALIGIDGAGDKWMFYLGATAMAAVGWSVFRRVTGRDEEPAPGMWAALGGALFFGLLTLGPPEILFRPLPLPDFYALTRDTGLPLFTAVARPWDYFIPTIICFGAAVIIAVSRLRRAHPRMLTPGVMLALCLLLMAELYMGPFEGEPVERNPELAAAMESGEGPVLIVPMGRMPSKLYLYQQVQTGVPLAEGMTARTLDAQYATLGESTLADALLNLTPLHCEVDWQRDAEHLEALGINRVILDVNREVERAYFSNWPQEARFGRYAVYDVSAFQSPCPTP